MSSTSANPLTRSTRKLVLAVVLVAAAGAYYINRAGAEDAVAETHTAPSVEVTVLEPREIRRWTHFSGRLTAVESAEIKPLVSGAIQRVLFEEGQLVARGDPLFVIDPRPHRAALNRAEAQLATARSRAQLAKDELERALRLVASKLVSQSVYDSAFNDSQVAQAAILEAQSAVSQATLNLEYAHISAPISGRVGRAELTTGNVVEAGANAPVLTSIVADDRLFAEFNVDEQTYIQFVRGGGQPQSMPVELTLAGGDSVVYRGHIHAFDNRLDTSSGTIRARAVFANTDGALAAGMYADIRLGAAQTDAALLVPERAIGTNQSRKYVYVIDADNTVKYREVVLGDHYQSHRMVESGVNAGERIAVNSLSHLRPNTVVKPVAVFTLNQVAAH